MEGGLQMSQLVNQKFKFKRGQQLAIERVNPLLDAGEPLVVFCLDGKTRLKIGDGVTYYKDLAFIGGETETEILTYSSKLKFPNPPSKDQLYYLYKAANEATLYRWNSNKLIYEALDDYEANLTIDDIEILSGGTASSLLG